MLWYSSEYEWMPRQVVTLAVYSSLAILSKEFSPADDAIVHRITVVVTGVHRYGDVMRYFA